MGLTFTPVVDALPNTLIVSDAAVASGLTLGTKTVQIVGTGEMSIDGGGWVGSGVVQNGSSVRLRVTTPAEELGQVTTVTVDLQSVGYVVWSVTNRDTLQDEDGTGFDETLGFSITPGAPIDESANASDEVFDGGYLLVEEQGVGSDVVDYALTTAGMVNEFGTGVGFGFPSPGEVIDEVGTSSDTLFGALTLRIDEDGFGFVWINTSLTTSTFVGEQGAGTDAIINAVSFDLIDEIGEGDAEAFASLRVAEMLAELGVGDDELTDGAAPQWMIDEVGVGTDTVTTTNNVTINYNNVGYGFDEPLLSYPTGGAWVFNARTMAVSRWMGLQATEVHEANGVVYGAAADGIYMMSETVAADASVESGLYDFGVIELKHLRHLYLTYTSNTPVHVGVVRSNGGGKARTLYGKPAYAAENPVQSRVNLGRGPLARYWGFTLNNTDGGFASVLDMRLVPNITTRRI